MVHLKEDLLSKAKSIVSVIYGIFLWVTKLSSAMQIRKVLLSHQLLQLDLGALIYSTAQNLNRGTCFIHSYMISSWPPSSSSSSLLHSMKKLDSSSSSSWSSTMGDLIGTESGVYMSSNDETLLGGMEETKPYIQSRRKRNQKIETQREYPPPIPSLARTGTLTGRMPWVLTRSYVDGRLILREERVKHYEYFEANRENGRLILNLIPLDHTIKCCHQSYENDKMLEQEKIQLIEEDNENMDHDFEADNNEESNFGSGDDNEGIKEQNEIILASSMPKPSVEKGSERKGDIRRCFTYASKTLSNSKFFPMPVPVNKPIDA